MSRIFLVLACTFGHAWSVFAQSGATVSVYSARKEHLIKPLFTQFTAETGIQVKYLTGKAGPLLKRIESEGASTPADMLMTVDAGNLWNAAERGVLQPVTSTILERNIPSHLRDRQGRWFGLSIRARTIAYSTRRVQRSALSTYQDLAATKWRGRLCLRTSKKVYNQSLLAMFIAQWGEKEAEEVMRGWVANLAKDGIFSSDTQLLKAIHAGQCDVGVVNSYYLGRLLKENPAWPVALHWPNQKSGKEGVHVNVSGAGVTRHAKNPKGAQKLLEWLALPKAQKMLADLNLEYPVVGGVKLPKILEDWGTFAASQVNVAEAGALQARAIKIFARVGYQ